MATATVPVTDALDPRIPFVRRADSRRQRRELCHIAAAAIVWGAPLVIFAIWLGRRAAQAVLGPAPNALCSLGPLAGLVAANLMLYQVLLMARVPVFERGFGRAGITRLHPAAGFWSFWLMLLHIALLVVGYALGATVSHLSQLLEFVVAYPWMWLAGIGTLLLILVVGTSIRAARRRGSYERWYLIHLLVYVGVFAAVPHMLASGVDFTSSAAAAVYWWGLWIASNSVSVSATRSPPGPNSTVASVTNVQSPRTRRFPPMLNPQRSARRRASNSSKSTGLTR